MTAVGIGALIYLAIGLAVGISRDCTEMKRDVPYPNATSQLSLRQIRICGYLDCLLLGPIVAILALLSVAGWINTPKDSR